MFIKNVYSNRVDLEKPNKNFTQSDCFCYVHVEKYQEDEQE